MNNETKIIVIQDENSGRDIEGLFIAPKDLDINTVYAYIERIETQVERWDVMTLVGEKFNLKEIPHDVFYA